MKKILLAAVVCSLSLMLVACGSTKNVVSGYKSGDVTLGEYKGLTYKATSTEITEEAIDAKVNSFLNSCKEEYEITDRAAELGDTLAIDYVGYMDGVAFDGGTGSTDLELGSKSFIDGFEDGLVGANAGDKVTLDLTFPDPYQNNPDFAGKPATFEVTVNAIKGYTIPEISDELVNEKTSYSTVEAYRASIKGSLAADAEQAAQENKEYEVIEKAIANATFNKDLTAEITESKNNLISNYDQMYQSYYGVDTFTVYSAMYGYTQEQFDEFMTSQAEMSVKYSYMLSAIAEAEKLEATDDEVKSLISEMINSYGYENEEALNNQLRTYYNADPQKVLKDQVLLNKATDIIVNSAVEE